MPATTPPFVTRYMAGELAPFFELKPDDFETALRRPLDRPRAALATELRREAERLGAPRQTLAAIEQLENPRSKVVVTGQQPGLLLGPAFTLSKAMSAVRLAQALHTDEAPVVPVFWVASQDHDTGEIDHAHLLDRDERLHRLDLPLPEGVAAGRIPFEREWRNALGRQLAGVGGRPEFLTEVCTMLDESARLAETYADLFSGLLYRLMGGQGLIILDPSKPGIAPFFRDVIVRELHEPQASVEAIRAAGEELRAHGFEPQLGRGREATNLFLEEEVDGYHRRFLLHFDGRKFTTHNGSYSSAELRDILEREPRRLTPAAGLRPITQDAVLPTAAFVVGPGELRYLAQLRNVYSHHGVPMPLIRPRATSVVIEPPVRRILDRYGLDFRKFCDERGRAFEQVVLELRGHGEAFEAALRRLETEEEELLKHVRAVDPTLEETVERSRMRIERTISGLREKAAAAVAKRDSTSRRHLERLEAQLFPGGQPQERMLSPFSFFLKFGTGPMVDLYRTMDAYGEHLLYP